MSNNERATGMWRSLARTPVNIVKHSLVRSDVQARLDLVTANWQLRENARRNNLCMAGIDELVRAGGLPTGAFFGYEPTTRRGFPRIHMQQAKTIDRAFELGLCLSAGQTAIVLHREGHLCPNGSTNWTAAMVLSIWNRVTYTGCVRHRKARHFRDRMTGQHVVCPRPLNEQVHAFNGELAIISKERFSAVAEAKRRRRKRFDPTNV
jgi:hypothetical protein